MVKKKSRLKLGVNIDHVATLRQARGGDAPDLCAAVKEAISGGADSITMHLREDRRHIQDADLAKVKRIIRVPLNLEMALDDGIVRIALKLKPEKVCIVPEKRQELTTEGGLNVVAKQAKLKQVIKKLHKKKIEVSLFIDPMQHQILAAHRVGADVVEIHTGTYANARGAKRNKELTRIKKAAKRAHQLGLIVNAGHGLDLKNVKAIVKIPELYELNIGHSIVCRSVFVGLKKAVSEMRKLMIR